MPMPAVLFFPYGAHTGLPDLLARYTPLVEPDGDHVFAEMDGRSRLDLLNGAGAGGFQLSVGVGANPLVARAALTAEQYDGRDVLRRQRTAGGLVLRVPFGTEAAFMAGLPVEALWPLPAKTIRRLRELGLVVAGDVARVGGRELRSRFGAEGVLIAAYSRGRDHRRVRALYPPPEAVWTFDPERVRDRGTLERMLAPGVEQITADLRVGTRGYRRLTLSLRLENGRMVENGRDYTAGAPDPLQMRVRLGILLSLLTIQAPVTRIRVKAGKLYRLHGRQIGLFTTARSGAEIRRVLGAVNLKYPGKLTRGYREEATIFRRERMREAYTG